MITGWHRPTRILVHPKRITENILLQKKQLPKDTEVFAVVKANGYGHGAVAVAKAALDAGVTGFCVALLDEALQLRENGITEPILILNMIDPHYIPLAVENDLSITCGNWEWLSHLLKEVEANPLKKPLQLHLKIDSGMGRIGFFTEESLKKAYDAILASNSLALTGIFTHFATADEADVSYYEKQAHKFQTLLNSLPQLPRYVHSSNSATALWHQAGIGNLVRMGVSMYGLNPSGNELALPIPLKPAMELVSELIQVKKVPVKTGISYGKTYETESSAYIGTVPIGYADGWLRRMQGFSLLVEGNKCPIVGRVCMDQLMLLLPKAYPIGTPVTLIGESQGAEITLQDAADYLGTIHYEICCQLSDRIPRIYVN